MSKPTCRLEIQRASGKTEIRRVRLPDEDCRHGTADGACPNPACRVEPFHITLVTNLRISTERDDEMIVGTRCVKCRDPVGYLFARYDTIFGLEEDMRLASWALSAHARVY